MSTKDTIWTNSAAMLPVLWPWWRIPMYAGKMVSATAEMFQQFLIFVHRQRHHRDSVTNPASLWSIIFFLFFPSGNSSSSMFIQRLQVNYEITSCGTASSATWPLRACTVNKAALLTFTRVILDIQVWALDQSACSLVKSVTLTRQETTHRSLQLHGGCNV